MLKARKLWHTINTGTENEEEDCAAMEPLYHSTRLRGVARQQGYHEACLGRPQGHACGLGPREKGEGAAASMGL